MFKEQTEERYQFKYPPHYRLVKITIRHRNFNTMESASKWFAEVLKLSLNENVLGPVSPPVARIRNEFISNILVKIPKEHSLQKTKAFIQKALQRFNAVKEFSRVKLIIDVDNY